MLAMAGAWFAVKGTIGLGHLRVHPPPGVVAATLWSFLLALPMIQSGRQLALAGASWGPLTGLVGVVLLNLCVLLPMIALAPYVSAFFRGFRYEHRLLIDWAGMSPNRTVFPLAPWRVDTVVLIVLSVLQLPVAVGKWNLGRGEGMMLIAGY